MPRVTEERTERILAGLRIGMTRRAAAANAGLSHMTFYRMLKDVTFVTEVEKAEGEAEGTYTAIVAKASEKNWTAAAWWLERRRSADYARHERVDMTVIDARKEAEKIAGEYGLDADAVLAEAEAILRE